MVDRSRSVAASDAVWDLDKAHHTPEHPRLRRLSSMNDHHPTFWEYASARTLRSPDAIADLVGPDVKFHHSKLNFKWSKGGDEVKWHQDIPSWPHTNYSPCTAGTYVYECNAKQGPLGVLRGSHNGPVVDQYDEAGEWTGCLKPAEAAAIDIGARWTIWKGRPAPLRSTTAARCTTRRRTGRRSASAAAERLLRGRRDALHGEPAAIEVLRGHRSGEARALGLS